MGREAAQLAPGRQHAVTRHDDRQRIAPQRLPDSLGGRGIAQLRGDDPICGCPPQRDGPRPLVNALVELRQAVKRQRYVAQVVGQQAAGETSWGIWYRQDEVTAGVPKGRWYFGRTALDASLHVAASEAAFSDDPADLDNEPIVQVTGVYNAFDNTLRLYIGEDEQGLDVGIAPEFPFAQQGSGELSIGRRRAGGVWSGYLPGEVGEVRIWAGAMTRDQVLAQVLGLCSTECDAQ